MQRSSPDDEAALTNSRHYIYVATLNGAIVCALARHVLGALVSAPPLLIFAVAALISYSMFRTGSAAKLLPWFFAGVASGFWLPATLQPPQAAIITHAPARFARADLFDALEQLDEHPQSLLGRRITVTGSWHRDRDGAVAAVYRRVMACCAADAIDVGFDVVPVGRAAANEGASVRVTGVVHASLRDGETRYMLRDATVTNL